MSKYVKNLVTDSLRERLQNVHDALLVNVVGIDANANTKLRAELREKNIQLVVVKNSMAARATEGTPLAMLFEGLSGTAAICWGSEDVVSLAKEITRLASDKDFAPFETRAGVMDGEQLTAFEVEQISKWPSRTEQLSILLGQILSPGAMLASQLNSVGGALASQVEQCAEGADEEETAPETTVEAPPEAAAEATPEATSEATEPAPGE